MKRMVDNLPDISKEYHDIRGSFANIEHNNRKFSPNIQGHSRKSSRQVSSNNLPVSYIDEENLQSQICNAKVMGRYSKHKAQTYKIYLETIPNE